MARDGLSNRERAELRKAIPRQPRTPRGEGEVRVAVAPKVAKVDATERDGLIWLGKKHRLTNEQLKAGLYYRDRYRDVGELSIRSCIDVGAGGGTSGPGTHAEVGAVSLSQAMREMFVLRWQVLRGQTDLITAMDGVCGLGHTVRYLAGGNHHRAAELEAALKIGLDLITAYRRTHLAAVA